MDVTVTRATTDNLTLFTWRFGLIDNFQLKLHYYTAAYRPSTRHKFVIKQEYVYYRTRDSMARQDVPLPDDVISEALQEARSTITFVA